MATQQQQSSSSNTKTLFHALQAILGQNLFATNGRWQIRPATRYRWVAPTAEQIALGVPAEGFMADEGGFDVYDGQEGVNTFVSAHQPGSYLVHVGAVIGLPLYRRCWTIETDILGWSDEEMAADKRRMDAVTADQARRGDAPGPDYRRYDGEWVDCSEAMEDDPDAAYERWLENGGSHAAAIQAEDEYERLLEAQEEDLYGWRRN